MRKLDKCELEVAAKAWRGLVTADPYDRRNLRRLGLSVGKGPYNWSDLRKRIANGPTDELLNHLYHTDASLSSEVNRYRSSVARRQYRREVCGPWLEEEYARMTMQQITDRLAMLNIKEMDGTP